MQEPKRIPKTLTRKLSELDDHLFLLREHLYRVAEDEAHLKILATELRVLVCLSNRTEGLVWRLTDELKVSDSVYLHVAGNVDTDHPHAQGLVYAFAPIQRGGLGDPSLPPNYYSFRTIIKEHEAVFVSGRGLTHEYLIKAIAQQMGSAHEDEGVEPSLVELGEIFVGGLRSYIPILTMDAELTLEIGEWVLERAEQELGFVRTERVDGYGDLTIVIRQGLKGRLEAKVPLYKFHSYVSGVEIHCLVGAQAMIFDVRKRGESRKEIWAHYPPGWKLNTDAVFAFSYCSRAKQAHAVVNGKPQDEGVPCDVGWLDARELTREVATNDYEDLLTRGFVLLYGRLLPPRDSVEILGLPPDGYGIWVYRDKWEQRGVFPTD